MANEHARKEASIAGCLADRERIASRQTQNGAGVATGPV
jgi:hypothetical protein